MEIDEEQKLQFAQTEIEWRTLGLRSRRHLDLVSALSSSDSYLVPLWSEDECPKLQAHVSIRLESDSGSKSKSRVDSAFQRLRLRTSLAFSLLWMELDQEDWTARDDDWGSLRCG